MIHFLCWVAVVLTAARSYNARAHLDPHGVLEHRAGLPAIGYATLMLLGLVVLVSITGAGGQPVGQIPAPSSLTPSLHAGVWA